MKIEIRKKGMQTAILISFDTVRENFVSVSERTKFYKELHGWKQTIVKESGRYEYNREGLLNEIPNIPVSNSVFIVAQENMKRMQEFFREWQNKVMFEMFPVLIDQKQKRELQEQEEEKDVNIE